MFWGTRLALTSRFLSLPPPRKQRNQAQSPGICFSLRCAALVLVPSWLLILPIAVALCRCWGIPTSMICPQLLQTKIPVRGQQERRHKSQLTSLGGDTHDAVFCPACWGCKKLEMDQMMINLRVSGSLNKKKERQTTSQSAQSRRPETGCFHRRQAGLNNSVMSSYETLLTPATCAASDEGKLTSPGGARYRGRWRGGLSKNSSKRHLNAANGGPKVVKVVADKAAEKRPAASNVVKRAMHKISKKTRRNSSPPSKPPPSAVVDAAPPKVCAVGDTKRSKAFGFASWCSGRPLRLGHSSVFALRSDSQCSVIAPFNAVDTLAGQRKCRKGPED